MTKGVWRESLNYFKPVFKRAWIWLLFATVIEELMNMAVGQLRQYDESYFIVGSIVSVLFQLFLSAIGVVIINQMIFDVKKNESSYITKSLKRNLKYVFIETTRAILPVLLRLVLFIIPGLIEGVRLYFVPYVAQFDQEYRAGRVDALERSRALVKGHLTEMILILILTVILSMVPRFYLESIPVMTNPLGYIVVFGSCMALELYADIVLFQTYERLSGALNGNSVSLSRTPQS